MVFSYGTGWKNILTLQDVLFKVKLTNSITFVSVCVISVSKFYRNRFPVLVDLLGKKQTRRLWWDD